MTDTHLYINHRKRLRERFQKTGAEGLHDYELLELLLTFSIPRRDVKPVAKKLISTYIRSFISFQLNNLFLIFNS